MSAPYQEIAALYERYGKMVLRRCRQLLRDDEFPSSLFNRIATNHCLNMIRDAKRGSPGMPE